MYFRNDEEDKTGASMTHTIVLYCIMRPCTDGRLDRYRIGIPRELSEIRTQPWLSEGSLTCDPQCLMTNKCQLLQANGIVFQVLIDAYN